HAHLKSFQDRFEAAKSGGRLEMIEQKMRRTSARANPKREQPLDAFIRSRSPQRRGVIQNSVQKIPLVPANTHLKTAGQDRPARRPISFRTGINRPVTQ